MEKVTLVEGNPYFADVKNRLRQFKYLESNLDCEVLIIGGGITGCLTAYEFAKAGINCVLVEKSKIGFLNTSCCTAMIEFALDDIACDLKLEPSEIFAAYNLGIKAMKSLENIILHTGNKCEYLKCDTVQFSHSDGDKESLLQEAKFRNDLEIPTNFYTGEDNPYNCKFKTAIVSNGYGASLNPYLLCKQLISFALKHNVKVFENTEIVSVIDNGNYVECTTEYGNIIKSKKVICATGYNTSLFTDKKLGNKWVTYSCVTASIKNAKLPKKLIMRDCGSGYHYIKFTKDNRIVIGGEDTLFKNNEIDLKLAEKKYENLVLFLNQTFPNLANKIKIDYKFSAAFATTIDNLGVVGSLENNKNIFYNLGYGGNGIVNSLLGAEFLVQKYKNGTFDFEEMLSPNRKLGN